MKRNVLILPLLLLMVIFSSMIFSNSVHAEEGNNLAYTAKKITSNLGTADGIKDDLYNSTTPIPISVVANDNGNTNPATANMYLLWDDAYLYVFAEVIDNTHYGYQAETLLEHRDAFEIVFDLYHKADYWLGGYGGEYRNEWYGSGANMCEGFYKIAAGVEQGTVDSTVQGTHWMWDDQKNNGSYYSGLTEIGYTVEMKISVGKDAGKYLQAGREIGVGVKVYDKYADAADGSVTTIEEKNVNQASGPRYLSNVVLVDGDEKPVKRDEVVLQGRDSYVANKTNKIIIADGVKDEAWDEASAIDLVYARQFANENIGRMTIYMLWDNDYFYLFAEVEDNTFSSCPASDIFNYNNYDSVGFALDLLRDTSVSNFDTGNYQTSVGFGSDYRGDKMCEGFWAVTRGASDLTIGTHWMCDDANTKSASSFASVSTETGYTVEMKIYAGNDKFEFMQEGRTIGVGLNVSDQFVADGTTSATVAHAVLDQKNFPNNDRAWGKVWAQGPAALSEVVLGGSLSEESFEDDGVNRKEYNASRVLSDTKINVDGVMDEVYNTTTEININTLVSGTTNVTAKARVMWTSGYLYVFVDVNDSTLGDLSHPLGSDSVIVAVDLLGDRTQRTSKWGSDTAKKGEGIFVANPGENLFGYGSNTLYERHLSRVASVIKEDGSGYTVEMRIELGENENVLNSNIGLAILVQDNANLTSNVIDGAISTNTQQDRLFTYNGVLDNVKLIANSSETKAEVNDADSPNYDPDLDVTTTPDEPTNTPDEPTDTPEPSEPTPNDGCKGSLYSSISLMIVLVGILSYILYKKNKTGKVGE